MTIQLWATPFAYGSEVRSEFLNYVRVSLASALDITNGGDYMPLAPIRIGGDGLALYDNAPLTIESGSTVTWETGSLLTIESGVTISILSNVGDVSTGDIECVNLTASADLEVVGDSNLGGNITTGGDLAVTGDGIFGGTFEVVGASTLASVGVTGGATVGTTLGVTGASTLAAVGAASVQVTNDLGVGGSATVDEDMRVDGVLRTRAPAYPSDADVTLDSATGSNRVIMPTPAANRVVTLRQSTSPVPVNGDWFEVTVILGASVFTVGLRREGSVDYVAVIGNSADPFSTSNYVASARVELVAGVWRLVSVGGAKVFRGADA